MPRGEKIILMNDKFPSLDIDANGDNYELETEDTGVIYMIQNLTTDKAYIGKAFSYVKNGNQSIRRHGAKDRFYKHWKAANNNIVSDCPIFYEALRNSSLDDWFVYTLKVCSKNHLKEWETKLIQEYKSSDPKYGYNYFVGDNKPDNYDHLLKYKTAKAKTNANRAIGGALKRRGHSKDLPANISYRKSKRRDGTIIGEGYFVQIKIGTKLYNKAFLSNADTMEEKLSKAKKQLELFKKEAAKSSGSKYSGMKTGKEKNK
ncbi:Group I intron endonuclease [Cotonvirus japonicus]|uniref:Group I intron endonuclease n=1 Tax=Cotonvirus japonicus TaxID=2811091 RepID=A0ABM7NS99_9VIRU|nr:Group I intron endonuclease [Cotonvirus japonicus]BCS83029.1 Group I intron endonuclease [Cotonvirus japonicus]